MSVALLFLPAFLYYLILAKTEYREGRVLNNCWRTLNGKITRGEVINEFIMNGLDPMEQMFNVRVG